MNSKQINLFLVQTEIILNQAKQLEGKNHETYKKNDVIYNYFLDKIDLLVRQYNSMIPKINELFKAEGIEEELKPIKEMNATLDQIRVNRTIFDSDYYLLRLIFGTSEILSFLKEGIILSETTQNKLDSITAELEEIKEILPNGCYTNLTEARIAFERGCFLGSSLISGRVVNSCLNQLVGKDINEKIELLKKYDLIREKDGKDFVIKANHFARNLASHELKIIPASSEAISYLGDAIKIAQLISDYQLKKENTSNSASKTIQSERKV